MLPATVQFLIAMVASAINERMRRRLEYADAELEVLRQMLAEVRGTNRLRFTAAQRRTLAVAGQALTPAERRSACHLVKPDTILAWFRALAARKYDSSSKRGPGRPRKPRDVRQLVVRMATDNPGWGYTKIRDAMRTGLKIDISRATIASILKDEAIDPAPERSRKRTWKTFLQAHWDTLHACDFFTVEVLGLFGAVRYHVFFVMRLKTRAVHIAGMCVNPHAEWLKQIARNLVDPFDGFLRDATHLILDRDPVYTDAFADVLQRGHVHLVKIPAKSPNCNPHAERFVRTARDECLRHFVIFGERHLRLLLKDFLEYYHRERFHQGIDGQLVSPCSTSANDNSAGKAVVRKTRLGGILSFYHHDQRPAV